MSFFLNLLSRYSKLSIEPKSLNIKFPSPKRTWRDQGFMILASICLSLYVVKPSTPMLAICAVIIGAPLSGLFFGSNLGYRYLSGVPIVMMLVIFTTSIVVVKLFTWVVSDLAKLLIF